MTLFVCNKQGSERPKMIFVEETKWNERVIMKRCTPTPLLLHCEGLIGG
jgi:hypothetical protein